VRRVRISGFAKPVDFAVMVRVLAKSESQPNRLEAGALLFGETISGEHPILTIIQTGNPRHVYVSQAGCRASRRLQMQTSPLLAGLIPFYRSS